MVAVSSDYAALAGPVGARGPVLRVSGGGPQGNLHDKRGGIVEHETTENYQDARVVSHRNSGPEAVVYDADQSVGKMGVRAALETDAELSGYLLWRPDARSRHPSLESHPSRVGGGGERCGNDAVWTSVENARLALREVQARQRVFHRRPHRLEIAKSAISTFPQRRPVISLIFLF